MFFGLCLSSCVPLVFVFLVPFSCFTLSVPVPVREFLLPQSVLSVFKKKKKNTQTHTHTVLAGTEQEVKRGVKVRGQAAGKAELLILRSLDDKQESLEGSLGDLSY